MGNVEERKKGWTHSFSMDNTRKKKLLTHAKKAKLFTVTRTKHRKEIIDIRMTSMYNLKPRGVFHWNCVLKMMNQVNKN